MAQAKHVLGNAAGIGVMLPDCERALVMQQTVQNMEHFAGVRGNHLSVERRKPIGDERVELRSRLRAVAGVVIGTALPMPHRLGRTAHPRMKWHHHPRPQ